MEIEREKVGKREREREKREWKGNVENEKIEG